MKTSGWKGLPIGGLILEGGTAEQYKTGGWRNIRPVMDTEKCINCLLCWVYCPDSSIMVENEKIVGFDLEHCKGCGICAKECPPKVQAIKMVSEAEFRG
ncbi:ferredoxin [Candidatus Desantisbacteria bacterium CG2_30_40_21]|uniref:Ferredoxin n=5 Tax=unclassified Candidatus Desantisiibacteriota TaxID=3106372 RepID=A0A2M7J874_9BACT|nr:MAG: ferredoxin [Candidatus Desantisbacteria bacterium CG2_30_40_21]PIP39796.1 MAG: ferredoxin [Candidatus Desantisbacteria bacterium CG23_combo_of_CG06-09_8_20_14_all_40_23]PIX15582.1 MAG: ferredoxin [Candidatus Desantisbacteria bacterium CG_4_8_14_3_um_filter_40_12]PIY19292.1 MAG: ferredoxin [Candidatus Desantisbacteria bacterium CG_4_10_14_3_um_filter_40_18]PJB27954.1 MAG: ferredoxin [Candidatus Desantisbacteria bacterium CG_4_9_14_3_um_filter_40_11]